MRLRQFAQKYYPDADLFEEEVSKSGKAVQMFEKTVEHITGKQIQEK